MPALSLHHLAFRTSDPGALAAFYADVLGLRVVREREGASVWLELGGGGVLMVERALAGERRAVPGTLELVAFRVDARGRDAVRARLAERGVAIEQETEHTTYFRDPDGRRVAVSTHPLA